ncbi:unnamed protein product [Leptidea sinapis]|uniref:Uncharacterized protein n=1 Tax=Leptidea sinapis TaxID=189913 RepID=A0A5E4Q817_9NEOP|nr:unnamed protein product [Leptidea sinapis]
MIWYIVSSEHTSSVTEVPVKVLTILIGRVLVVIFPITLSSSIHQGWVGGRQRVDGTTGCLYPGPWI